MLISRPVLQDAQGTILAASITRKTSKPTTRGPEDSPPNAISPRQNKKGKKTMGKDVGPVSAKAGLKLRK